MAPVAGTCFLYKYYDIQLNKHAVVEGHTIPSSKSFELQGIKHSWIYCAFNFYVNIVRSLTSEIDVEHLVNFKTQSEIWRTKYKLDAFYTGYSRYKVNYNNWWRTCC
jgi:hypothetical protein